MRQILRRNYALCGNVFKIGIIWVIAGTQQASLNNINCVLDWGMMKQSAGPLGPI